MALAMSIYRTLCVLVFVHQHLFWHRLHLHRIYILAQSSDGRLYILIYSWQSSQIYIYLVIFAEEKNTKAKTGLLDYYHCYPPLSFGNIGCCSQSFIVVSCRLLSFVVVEYHSLLFIVRYSLLSLVINCCRSCHPLLFVFIP